MFKKKVHPLVSAILCCSSLSLLTACGGTEEPNEPTNETPNIPQTPSQPPENNGDIKLRVKQITTDADNNGVFEYTNTRTYNDEGFLVARDTLFNDDGTPDIELLGFIFSDDQNTIIEYDSENRIGRFSSSFDGIDYISEYVYENALKVREMNEKIIFTNGEMDFITTTTYTNEFLNSTFRQAIGGVAGQIDIAQEFIFNNEQQLVERNVTGSGDSYRYRWDANGLVAQRTGYTTINGALTDTHDYIYDQDANLVEYLYTPEFDFSESFRAVLIYTSISGISALDRIEIDESNNGTVDAVIKYEWEEAACEQSLIFGNYLSTPIHINQADIPAEVQYGTGWGAMNLCLSN